MKNIKIAIMADSHDNIKAIDKAINIANKKNCTHLFHLGDIVSPFSALILKNFQGKVNAVFGNNDGEILGLQKVFNNFGGEISRPPISVNINKKKIILMHEPILIEELLSAERTDYIFYGHLHKIHFKIEGQTTILNPGESAGWVEKPSFFILELETNNFTKIIL